MSFNNFHPITRFWFEKHLGSPTEAQIQAWPAIAKGENVLIAAPTGSGKTLAAFYAIIDRLIQQGLESALPEKTSVVYVSPLKALSNDIYANLQVPLLGIAQEMRTQGIEAVDLRIAVRTGDTTPQERLKMIKNPPHILVTTPESLYLLLTSEGGRHMLGNVKTVIVDEIHAVLGSKRGSHLALSIERLEALVSRKLQRIGLSATQKPIDLVANFLVGRAKGRPDCVIVNAGQRHHFDITVEVPKSPLSAVMSTEIWGELYERVIELVNEHRTTLIFVNTRRLAERLGLALSERLGGEHVSTHHGSMSKEHRHKAEQRLKAGELKVLVATASMELGIDIGAVDLVIQFSSPLSIAAFLQRIGRSRHYVGGTPKGIIFPLSRDDLAECTAILDSVRRRELDRIIMPQAPLDILSQQIIAEISCQERTVNELYEIYSKAYPYKDLTKERFLEIIHMLAEGFISRRGRRRAYLYYDAINDRIKGRPGARLTALTNGGAIPDSFDYDVILQPEGIKVGTLNEDYALETMAGDIFTLGTHSWKLIRIEGLKAMVHDAAGQAPSVPFWLGEKPGRTEELSESLSRLRSIISDLLDKDPLSSNISNEKEFSIGSNTAVKWLVKEVGISQPAAEQLVSYFWMAKVGLGIMPTRDTIVMERFFDEAGDMHLVIHSLYGSQINRAWGLALRKRFCRNFNFELEAAANEDSIILSLSSSHSFPIDEVFRYLNTKTVKDILIQAMLDAPLFEIRWRWTASLALAIIRNRHGQRVPPHLQRMQAEDLVAQVFPDQIACFENIQGERKIPQHPLVDQVIDDCLHDAMDIDGLIDLLSGIENKTINIITKDLREPSIFAQEIINARPYAFLDDKEFGERRINAVKNRGWLDPAEARELSQLDPTAIDRVKQEAWPQAENIDEMHDALLVHGFVTQQEVDQNNWKSFLNELAVQGRSLAIDLDNGICLWIAIERLPFFKAIYKNHPVLSVMAVPQGVFIKECDLEEALREVVRGRLEALGPVTADNLAHSCGLSQEDIEQALLGLEHEGFVFRGKFTPSLGTEEWCERRLLQRIHRYTVESLRQSIQPVSVQDYMRFLFDFHGLNRPSEEKPSHGPQSLQFVLGLLEGFEAPASCWEADLIPGRMGGDYDPAWLDVLCMSGKITWGRFILPKINGELSKKTGPIKSTPITLVPRTQILLWRQLKYSSQGRALSTTAQKVKTALEEFGASFFDDIAQHTGLLKAQVEQGIAELVADGLVVADSYSGLRALLTPQYNRPSVLSNNRLRNRRAVFGIESAGRWSLLGDISAIQEKDFDYETLEYICQVYLRRWGVVFRALIV